MDIRYLHEFHYSIFAKSIHFNFVDDLPELPVILSGRRFMSTHM